MTTFIMEYRKKGMTIADFFRDQTQLRCMVRKFHVESDKIGTENIEDVWEMAAEASAIPSEDMFLHSVSAVGGETIFKSSRPKNEAIA